MTGKSALIMVKLDTPAAREAEWNRWYNTKHLPDRLKIEGFKAARRFVKVEGTPPGMSIPGEPNYLSLYEIAGPGVVKTEAYKHLRDREAAMPRDSFEIMTNSLRGFARGIYDELFSDKPDYHPPRTPYILVVGHEIPRNRHQEFNAWYNTEHVPSVLTVPGIVTGRRFKLNTDIKPMLANGGSLPTFLTVYDLENAECLVSREFNNVVHTPWSDWVRTWFRRTMCMVYRRVYPE